jgi:hypothetical protein
MGLELKYSFCEQCDVKNALFNDTTGVYALYDNPTGYGTPNVESTAITSATLSITPPTYESPLLFSFTISSGVVTAATRTDEFGVVTDILSLLNSTAFPFFDLNLDSVILYGDTEASELVDGSYQVIYTITDGTDIWQLDAFNYFIEKATQCKAATAKGYTNKTISEANAIKVFINYDVLLVSVGLDDPDAVNSQADAMVDLCNSCNNC